MPLVYTKEEIKAYLADRGFDINDEEMINRFIHDLKKMVKYEDRGRRRKNLGHDTRETNLDSTNNSVAIIPVVDDEVTPERRQEATAGEEKAGTSSKGAHVPRVLSGHNQSAMLDTTDSKKKKASLRPKTAVNSSQKENVAPSAARIVMTRKTFNQQNGDAQVEESFVQIGETSRPKKVQDKTVTENAARKLIVESKEVVSTFRNKKSLNVDSNTQNKASGLPPSSRTSKYSKSTDFDTQDTDELIYILGNLLGECDDDKENDKTESVQTFKPNKGPPMSVKRDPVALYHYYQGIWKNQAIPGESRHMQLRWNVRAQTVNFPCIDGRPIKYLR